MIEDEVTVTAQDAGGGLEQRTRTLYSTHHGPIFNGLAGRAAAVDPATAFSMGDANANNFRYLNHFFETNLAQSTDELDEVIKRNQGIPWVNTIAADSAGKAYYADISVTPNVTDEKAATCNTPVGRRDVRSCCGCRSWTARSRPASGTPTRTRPSTASSALDNMPSHFRNDYTSNMNDSYWLSNPEDPLDRASTRSSATRRRRARCGRDSA